MEAGGRLLTEKKKKEKKESKKDSEGQFDFRLIVSRSQKIKLTCYCKSKGKRKRARYIVPLLKKHPRQKQIPRCVRGDGEKRKRGSSRSLTPFGMTKKGKRKSRFIAKIGDGAEVRTCQKAAVSG